MHGSKQNQCVSHGGQGNPSPLFMPQPIVDQQSPRKCNLHALGTMMGDSKKSLLSHPTQPPPQLMGDPPVERGGGGEGAALLQPQPPNTAVHTLPTLVPRWLVPRGRRLQQVQPLSPQANCCLRQSDSDCWAEIWNQPPREADRL